MIFTTLFSVSLFAQSGRVKPVESPTPSPNRPRVAYKKVEIFDTSLPKPSPTPTQSEKTTKDEEDVISVNSILVPIPVSITDMAGKAVTNLRLEDFELTVDGNKAEISEVAQTKSPVKLALLFDNSSSVIQAREFEQKAAIRFFKQVMRPDKDQAALYSVATSYVLEQPLTNNVSSLVRAIENLPNPEGATALLDAIIAAANYLQDYQGRRVIVIVSDGEDTLSDSTFERTLKTAQTANCQIYVVKTTDFENFKRTGERTSGSNTRGLTAERRMQELARQTGGAVYSPVDENELNKSFARISGELSEQYVLSYYPETPSARGKYVEISLKVKNKGNVVVRARKGYYVPR